VGADSNVGRALIEAPGRDSISIGRSDLAALKKIVAALEESAAAESDQALTPDESSVAHLIMETRRIRAQIFPSSMFKEVAWDMLIALYVANEARSLSDLARWTDTPTSTAMRWIEYLEGHNLTAREDSPDDSRAYRIRLTDSARAKMKSLFGQVAKQLLSPASLRSAVRFRSDQSQAESE